MSPELVGIFGILLLLILILLRLPVAFALIIVGAAGYAYLINPNAALIKLGTDTFNTAHSYTLSVIPMFILMGMFLGGAGLGRDLFRAFNAWIGHIRGGLAVATIVTCAAFSAVSGSVIATTATIATVAIPEMRAHKYKDSLAAGCVASGSTLGILIPPSGILIVYGVLTEESIGQLLIAGIFPGILTAVLLALAAWIQVRINPSLAPGIVHSTVGEKIESLKYVWPVPLIFGVTMGGIYYGMFTPTEGGAMGAFLALAFVVVSRRMKWGSFVDSLQETSKIIAMLMIIIIGGMIFGHFLSVSRIPFFLRETMMDLPPLLLITGIFLCYFVAGFVMDELATLIIFTSLFYPLVISAGYDGIWYGIVSILMILIGFLTPPVGVVSLVTASITKIQVETVFRGVVPFWIALIVSTFLVILFPQIATFLPGLMR
jgi:tripartite ATP-independent transporter DctM subunit